MTHPSAGFTIGLAQHDSYEDGDFSTPKRDRDDEQQGL